ncbi:hypothetical protein ACFR9U_11685 [Halorientalis brevis]|uniref:Uncharacterized protein n=1 Tax=Halorientalis brevis TaxID=1126241 RepID=A0ABD6CDZ8_9EURY
MRQKALTLAVAALLALGASGVVAATMDGSTADAASADVLPANYTVDVTNPEMVSDEAADTAIETAWANEDVRSHFDDGAAVHFDLWASELDDGVIHVSVAPMDDPDDTRVIADVALDQETVTSVDEPVTLNVSSAMSINASETDVVSVDGSEYELRRDDSAGEENATRLTADQAVQIELNESSIERRGNGTFTIEIDD